MAKTLTFSLWLTHSSHSSYALSFYVTKTVLVGPKWFLSGPNVIHFGRKSQFGPDQFILVVTISFWSWPNHYGQVQINLVRPKPFWTDQNCFGHIEEQGISWGVFVFYKLERSSAKKYMVIFSRKLGVVNQFSFL